MEEIIKLYNEHLATEFPDLKGEEILGIDLVLIDSDTAGLISTYIGNRGHLTSTELKILVQCYIDLKTVVKGLNGADRQYFAHLQNISGRIINTIKNENHKTEEKPSKKEWESAFLKIREILNEWDPICVADLAADEYDTMNFRVLSILINNQDEEQIRKTLDDYLRNSMDLIADSKTLDDVAEKIKKIKLAGSNHK